MTCKEKKMAAALAAVTTYIQQEEEACYAQMAAAAAPPKSAPAAPVNLWGVSGRQAMMQMGQLMQLKAFGRIR